MAVSILIFPHTMSYEFLRNLSQTIEHIEHIVAFQRHVLRADVETTQCRRNGDSNGEKVNGSKGGPEDEAARISDAWKPVEVEVTAKRQAIAAGVQDLDGKSGMLELEGEFFLKRFISISRQFVLNALRSPFISVKRKIFRCRPERSH